MTRSPTTTEPVAPALPSRLRMVVTRLARRLRQQGEAAASPTQLAALATIERDGPLTLGALAAIERVRPPTITAAVGRLEEQRLVHRRTDSREPASGARRDHVAGTAAARGEPLAQDRVPRAATGVAHFR